MDYSLNTGMMGNIIQFELSNCSVDHCTIQRFLNFILHGCKVLFLQVKGPLLNVTCVFVRDSFDGRSLGLVKHLQSVMASTSGVTRSTNLH